jgi:hypothetical protein
MHVTWIENDERPSRDACGLPAAAYPPHAPTDDPELEIHVRVGNRRTREGRMDEIETTEGINVPHLDPVRCGRVPRAQ